MVSSSRLQAGARALGAVGALLAAASVALSAFAAHGSEGVAQHNLQTAAIFGFGHGIALAALARNLRSGLAMIALLVLLLGTGLFSGALVSKYLFGLTLGVAPAGGTALIVGWVLYAVAAFRE